MNDRNKFDTSIRLMLAYLCAAEEKSLERKVGVLDRFGLTDAEIAATCGSAIQSIRNARQAYKKSLAKIKKGK